MLVWGDVCSIFVRNVTYLGRFGGTGDIFNTEKGDIPMEHTTFFGKVRIRRII